MNEVCTPPNMAAKSSHTWHTVDGTDVCKRCGVSFRDHTVGFGTNCAPKKKRTRTLAALSG